MGYFCHNTMFLMTWNDDAAKTFRTFCEEDLTSLAFEYHKTLSNGLHCFVVFPDGSKEGWQASNLGDEAREAIKKRVQEIETAIGWKTFRWFEVASPEDGPDKIVDGGCES